MRDTPRPQGTVGGSGRGLPSFDLVVPSRTQPGPAGPGSPHDRTVARPRPPGARDVPIRTAVRAPDTASRSPEGRRTPPLCRPSGVSAPSACEAVPHAAAGRAARPLRPDHLAGPRPRPAPRPRRASERRAGPPRPAVRAPLRPRQRHGRRARPGPRAGGDGVAAARHRCGPLVAPARGRSGGHGPGPRTGRSAEGLDRPPRHPRRPPATGYFPSGHTATAMVAYGTATLLLLPSSGHRPYAGCWSRCAPCWSWARRTGWCAGATTGRWTWRGAGASARCC